MKKEDKKMMRKLERTFDYGTHPGAYTNEYDPNNELLDTINAADDIFKYNIRQPRRNANPASPSAPDPAVPNRAHTEM
ncbi:MAG: hypothetical protein E7649_02700 [Ruminococcaceae bacterium]|nr:hypothetical protein [Oscillospiraceae bacterium]